MWLRREYPTPPDTETYLLCVPGELMPIITGHLLSLTERTQWDTRDDWKHGAGAIKEILANMSCLTSLTDRLDRIISALGYDAGLDPANPTYNANDTLKAALVSTNADVTAILPIIDQLETYTKGIADLIGTNTMAEPNP